MTVILLRDGGAVDLGEAQGGDPLSTTARTLLDDVQLPPTRTVCRLTPAGTADGVPLVAARRPGRRPRATTLGQLQVCPRAPRWR